MKKGINRNFNFRKKIIDAKINFQKFLKSYIVKIKKSKTYRIIVKYVKKLISEIKQSYKKLKYLDKTKYNYFVVTSFLGIFCIFTGFTYSAFVVSKYLNAATITIAKLNYTLTSSTNGYNNGVINVPADGKVIVDLTLNSLNSFKTKYALNYTSTSPDITVKYSSNLKNNVTGIIGSSGSSINMRVIIINPNTSPQDVTFTVQGGYLQNELTTNITEIYYEKDITLRTILLDENFDNPTNSLEFPLKNSEYAYYKTECDGPNTIKLAVWDNDNWTLNLQPDFQTSCDVYFKKLKSDIEVSFMLYDKDGKNHQISSNPPDETEYTYKDTLCSTGSATWDTNTKKLNMTGIKDKTVCVANFIHK